MVLMSKIIIKQNNKIILLILLHQIILHKQKKNKILKKIRVKKEKELIYKTIHGMVGIKPMKMIQWVIYR